MTKKKKLTTTNTEDAWCEDFWWRKHAHCCMPSIPDTFWFFFLVFVWVQEIYVYFHGKFAQALGFD